MLTVVAGVVERLWPGRTAEIELLSGGITNSNFRVDFGDEQLVVRVPGANTYLLGIDRGTEVEANRIAAKIGIAPEVVLVDEISGYIVTRFIDGRTVSMAELAREPLLGEVVATLRRVHRAGLVRTRFDHFEVIRGYHDEARARGVKEPFDYGAASGVLERIELVRPFEPAVLGHNDLLNANFLHDGSVRLLDWEYAGMADPFFDLANFSVNNELGAECDEPIIRHYFGRVDRSLVAALLLTKLISELREAMWGVLQIALSELDVDFVEYATERGQRFGELLARTDLERQLDFAFAGR